MSFISKIRGISSALFKIGIGGNQVKNNGTGIEFVNATDSGFVVGRGAPPVGANDFVTLGSLVPAPSGVVLVAVPILLVSTASAAILPANAVIRRTSFKVTIAYDNGALWSFGKTAGSATLLQITGDNDPANIDEYGNPNTIDWGAGAATISATRSGGVPTVGAGVFYVEYVATPLV